MSASGENYNEDELSAPNWVNLNFFNKILQGSEKDEEIQVKDFKITPGSAKGDHLASTMFRAEVSYMQKGAEKSLKMIVKTMPEDGIKKEMIENSKVFHTEIAVYKDFIPKIEQTLKEVGDKTIFAPKLLYFSLEPRQVIVLEDLVPLGFEVLRSRQPNEEESKSVLLKLAKWHAVTHKMLSERPDDFDDLRYGLLSDEGVKNFDFFTAGIINFVEVLKTVPSLQKYAAYFESIQPALISDCIKSFNEYFDKSADSRYYVLSHGDFHSKNCMFKYNLESGELLESILFDLQLSSICSNAIDIIYAIYMLFDDELKFSRRDEMIYYYFSNFVETLKKIGFNGPMPKLLEFKRHIKELKAFEIWVMTTFMPLFYITNSEDDIEKVLTSPEVRKKLYHNKRFIDDLERLLPKFMHSGYFES